MPFSVFSTSQRLSFCLLRIAVDEYVIDIRSTPYPWSVQNVVALTIRPAACHSYDDLPPHYSSNFAISPSIIKTQA